MITLDLTNPDDYAELKRRVGERTAKAIRFGLAYGMKHEGVKLGYADAARDLSEVDYAAIEARILATTVKP